MPNQDPPPSPPRRRLLLAAAGGLAAPALLGCGRKAEGPLRFWAMGREGEVVGELLADFREVEHNFRGLDRRVRERIAL